MSINIDARGLACPQPVIETKKALEGISDGVVIIRVDNLISKENVVKFASAHGCGVSITPEGTDFVISITKGLPKPEEVSSLVQAKNTDTVYVITQETLGNGSLELGKVLMKGFIYTLLESRPMPKALIFMNGGVLLTVKGSLSLENLQKLEQAGVEILSCGTCLDYLEVKETLAVGGVTNMYTIVEMMSAAKKVITL